MEENTPISRHELFKLLGDYKYSTHMDTKRGGAAKEQEIVYFQNGCLFQSYGTDIAAFVFGQLYVNEGYHDYSNTTMKYCKEFTDTTVGQRRNGIKNGTIKTFA